MRNDPWGNYPEGVTENDINSLWLEEEEIEEQELHQQMEDERADEWYDMMVDDGRL